MNRQRGAQVFLLEDTQTAILIRCFLLDDTVDCPIAEQMVLTLQCDSQKINLMASFAEMF
jgi:hypothetical protein